MRGPLGVMSGATASERILSDDGCRAHAGCTRPNECWVLQGGLGMWSRSGAGVGLAAVGDRVGDRSDGRRQGTRSAGDVHAARQRSDDRRVDRGGRARRRSPDGVRPARRGCADRIPARQVGRRGREGPPYAQRQGPDGDPAGRPPRRPVASTSGAPGTRPGGSATSSTRSRARTRSWSSSRCWAERIRTAS